MYCSNCGNRLMGYEKYCSNCGHIIDESNNNFNYNVNNNNNDNYKSTEGSRNTSIILGGISLGGVILGIFAPISLILSIIGLILAIKSNKNSKNTIGIILNAISLFISFIITSFIILIIWLMVDTSQGIYDNYWPNITNTYHENSSKF